jgi:cytochrome c
MRFLHSFFGLTLAVAVTLTAHASPELAKAKNCLACHAQSAKLVGPSFTSIASKYENDGDATERLAQKIQKGSSGAWGPIPMPANPQVNKDDAMALARWILAKR